MSPRSKPMACSISRARSRFAEDGSLIKGRLGENIDLEAGQAAARRCGIMLLAQMKAALGSLDRVERIVKLGVFVNSAMAISPTSPRSPMAPRS